MRGCCAAGFFFDARCFLFSFSGFDFDFLKLNIILVEKIGWGLAQSQRNGLRGKNWLFHFFFLLFFFESFFCLCGNAQQMRSDMGEGLPDFQN